MSTRSRLGLITGRFRSPAVVNQLHKRMQRDLDTIQKLTDEVAKLRVELASARNMSRHNYRCAVREQVNAKLESGHGLESYPPLVDDEYKLLEDAALKVVLRWYEYSICPLEDDNWVALDKLMEATRNILGLPAVQR